MVTEDEADGLREQSLYWEQLISLKTLAIFVRLYADEQGRWIRRIGVAKAIATSSTIAGWSIWKDYALVWGCLLAAAQLLDAIKEYLPHQKNQRAASELAMAAEVLFVDARFEWESVLAGRLNNDDILIRWQRLAKLQLEAERKYFPDGIPGHNRLRAMALRQTETYFRVTDYVGDQR